MVTATEQIITLSDGTCVVYDYSTGFMVTKGRDGCYISIFDRKTLNTPTQQEFDKMNEGSDNVTLSSETEYIVDKVSHVDPTILSKNSKQMCAKSEILWMFGAPKGQLSERQKRSCHRECSVYCSCCPRDCGFRCSITCEW